MNDTTARLVTHCLEATETPPTNEELSQLKLHLLDHIGLVIGGFAQAESTPAIADGIRAISGNGSATVIPTGESLAPDGAALINGAMAHSLDFDDTHKESSLHPGAPVIPAALAVAEQTDVTTDRLLAAITAGFDIACGLGRAVNPDNHYAQGFHITATCGTFGATAAAGIVAGLEADELAAAFGINGSQAAGSLQFLANGAWNKRLHPGLAARRGVTAASLAGAGFRGAADPIEGEYGFFNGYTSNPNPGALDDLADRSAVIETALKPYPCCRYMHPALDGLVDIATDITADAVDSIRVELPRAGVRLTGAGEAKQRPSNFVDCQFSMPFAAALALTTGSADIQAFLTAQSNLNDPELRRLMSNTSVTSTERVQSLFPEQWAARVVVETDTETHERFIDQARGEPENPLCWAEVEAKFRSLTEAADWPDPAADAIIATINDIETHSFDALIDALKQAPTSATAD